MYMGICGCGLWMLEQYYTSTCDLITLVLLMWVCLVGVWNTKLMLCRIMVPTYTYEMVPEICVQCFQLSLATFVVFATT